MRTKLARSAGQSPERFFNRVPFAKRMTYRPWTPIEDELLQKLRASGLTWHVVAKRLGKTEAAIIGRAGTLQLRQLGNRKQSAEADSK